MNMYSNQILFLCGIKAQLPSVAARYAASVLGHWLRTAWMASACSVTTAQIKDSTMLWRSMLFQSDPNMLPGPVAREWWGLQSRNWR